MCNESLVSRSSIGGCIVAAALFITGCDAPSGAADAPALVEAAGAEARNMRLVGFHDLQGADRKNKRPFGDETGVSVWQFGRSNTRHPVGGMN